MPAFAGMTLQGIPPDMSGSWSPVASASVEASSPDGVIAYWVGRKGAILSGFFVGYARRLPVGLYWENGSCVLA